MCGRNLITGLTSAASPRVDISSTCKVGQTFGSVSPSVDMLPFGVTIPATVPQRSEIPEGLMNYSVWDPKICLLIELRNLNLFVEYKSKPGSRMDFKSNICFDGDK